MHPDAKANRPVNPRGCPAKASWEAGLIQFPPLRAVGRRGFRQFRLVREVDVRPRRLFGFVSPARRMLALALPGAVIGVDLYVNNFHLFWGSDAVQQGIVMVVSNLALATVDLFPFYGRKRNPHQAASDHARQTRAQRASLLLLSCATSVFFIWQTAGDAFRPHCLDASAMSPYFQGIVALLIGLVLRRVRFEHIDVDVYTANP